MIGHPILTLITPRILSSKNSGRTTRRWIKIALFTLIGGLFWLGIFAISLRVLSYISGIEEVGDILANKLLSMVLIIFFSLLVFSSLLTALSKLYLSKDLGLVHAFPVPSEQIFFARWIESTIDSSWMMVVYSIPVLSAFGIVYDAGWFYYCQSGLTMMLLCIISSAISALSILVTVMILPANRIRSIFVFLGLLAFVVLYIAFRLLKPERLVDPETFASTLLYLRNLSTPSSPLLPSTWMFDSIMAALNHNVGTSFFHLALLGTGAGFVVSITLMLSKMLYFSGFSKSQIAGVKLFKSQGNWMESAFSLFPGPGRAFLIKEIKTFWRDQTQWSQLFLIAALIVIYLYNFSVLPLEKSPIRTVYLINLLSFLNMALVSFVLTAVTARFAFPSVSVEGSAFWIVRSYPISIRTFVLIKFFIYLLPLLLLTELLTIATNLLLQVSPFMVALSSITLLFVTPGVVAIGIGLGSAFPDFSSENPSQTVTSFGGVLFMLISTAFIGVILIMEAGPTYTLFMSRLRENPLTMYQILRIWGTFIINILISVVAIAWPLTFGIRRLSNRFHTTLAIK